MFTGLYPCAQRTDAGTIPHSKGLFAVDTTPRFAPLTIDRSPEKLLLYRKRMKSVSDRLLHSTVHVALTAGVSI